MSWLPPPADGPDPHEEFAWWKPLVAPGVIVAIILLCVLAGQIF